MMQTLRNNTKWIMLATALAFVAKLPRRAFTDEKDGITYRFCCQGCRHVFSLLSESGLIQDFGDFSNWKIMIIA